MFLQKNAAQQTIADHGYDASDNPTSTVDALGYETRQSYDPLNRLKQTIQDVAGLNVQTDYQYDALDRLTRVTDPKGLHTDYGYDGLGNLRTLTSPDTGVTSHTPDAAGNRISQTDARGVVMNFTYDPLNRLSTVSYPSASSLNSSFVYDTVDATCASGETFALGRLARMTDASGSTDYCYDRFGHLARKVQTTNGQTLTTRYAYTPGGRLTTLTTPSGTQVDYTRNALGQITGLTVTPAGGSTTTVINSASYLPFGPVTTLSYGKGRTQTRAYDADYAIDAIANPASGGLDLDVSVDTAGNPIEVTSGSAGNRFDYDPLHRLVAVTSLANTPLKSYTYDATGNRLSQRIGTGTPESYVYAASSHRLAGIGASPRAYDANGNTTDRSDGLSLIYTAANRLGEVQGGKSDLTYRYNGRGERVAKVSAELTENRLFSYDEAGRLLTDFQLVPTPCICLPGHPKPPPTAAPLTDYVWLDDLPVAAVRDGMVYYVEADHLGTPRAVVDPQQDVAVWTWNLIDNPFGEAPPDQDPDGDRAEFEFNLRYPGQYFDSESGLHYNYFRDFEPGTGRYVESDPIGLSGGVSTYAYVEQNPLGFFDADGLRRRGIMLIPPHPPRDTAGCIDETPTPLIDRDQGKGCPAIQACISAHEYRHLRNMYSLLGNNPCAGNSGKKYTRWINMRAELRESECQAHRVELSCLQTRLRRGIDLCDEECQRRVRRRIDDIINYELPGYCR